jgi:hypothetical protein
MPEKSKSRSYGSHESPYVVTVHAVLFSNIVLNPATVRNDWYYPSQSVRAHIRAMWVCRRPHLVGSVSEETVEEILNSAAFDYEGMSWALTCMPIREFAPATSWRPVRGIHSDDLMTIARSDVGKLFFITEVKGTTIQRGISHTYMAKIYYQLPQTRKVLCERVEDCIGNRVGGISVEVDHLRHEINLNLLTPESNLVAELPDDWITEAYGRNPAGSKSLRKLGFKEERR